MQMMFGFCEGKSARPMVISLGLPVGIHATY